MVEQRPIHHTRSTAGAATLEREPRPTQRRPTPSAEVESNHWTDARVAHDDRSPTPAPPPGKDEVLIISPG